MIPRPFLPLSTWTSPVTPPPISVHPKNIQVLIRRLKSPRQVQAWIHTLRYNQASTMHTLANVVQQGQAHCLEAALAAATILEYHGYPPLILDLESTDRLDHTLFLYRQRGRYGTVGLSRDIGLAGRRPAYRNLHVLAQSYAAPYIDEKACLTGYGVLDLHTLPRSHWRTSRRSVWYVEEVLRHIPHRRLPLNSMYIWTWRRRYVQWRRDHGRREPTYFPRQRWWT